MIFTKKFNPPEYQFGNLKIKQKIQPEVYLSNENLTSSSKKENLLIEKLSKYSNVGFHDYSGDVHTFVLSQEESNRLMNIKKIFFNGASLLVFFNDNTVKFYQGYKLYPNDKLSFYEIEESNEKLKQDLMNIEKTEEVKNLFFTYDKKGRINFLMLHTKKGNLYGYGKNYFGAFGYKHKVKELEELTKLNKKSIQYLIGIVLQDVKIKVRHLTSGRKYEFDGYTLNNFFLTWNDNKNSYFVTDENMKYASDSLLRKTFHPVKVKGNYLLIPQFHFLNFIPSKILPSIVTYDLESEKFIKFPGTRTNPVSENQTVLLLPKIITFPQFFIHFVADGDFKKFVSNELDTIC